MITDTYNVQTRAQAKAQANVPPVLDAQPIMQKITPEVAKLPTKADEKGGDIRALLSRITQQSPRSIVLPPEFMLPPISVPPSVRPSPKPPDRSIISRAATGTGQTGEHLKIYTKAYSMTSGHRQNPLLRTCTGI